MPPWRSSLRNSEFNFVKKNVTINSRKFDGTIRRSWQADLIEQTDSLLVFLGVFEKEVKHPDLGVIRRGTISYEFYWLDRWYNVFRFHEPEGDLRNFYCNLNLPPVFRENSLDYIDLDLDILVWKDFSYEILDEDEFLASSENFKYEEKIINGVEKNKFELLEMIESRKFPFDFQAASEKYEFGFGKS